MLLVFRLVLLGFLDHALDLILRQTALIIGNGDLVLLAGGLVLSRNVEDSIGINVEAHTDLGYTPWGRRNSRKFKLAKQVVVRSS
mmetsp:Transcript_20468/g.28365  ORF Transcript_20468/g.28365 Transcript_20468/m.28365 type:complete len:85 (-) Transcript_20468:1453-1707(-)